MNATKQVFLPSIKNGHKIPKDIAIPDVYNLVAIYGVSTLSSIELTDIINSTPDPVEGTIVDVINGEIVPRPGGFGAMRVYAF